MPSYPHWPRRSHRLLAGRCDQVDAGYPRAQTDCDGWHSEDLQPYVRPGGSTGIESGLGESRAFPCGYTLSRQPTIFSSTLIVFSQTAFNGKLTWLYKFGRYNHALWDKLIFSKLKEMLGGRVRFLYTGAAPISREVLDFLKVAFSCPVVEGYGQTESMAGTTVTYPKDTKAVGTIGVPIPGVHIKLVDVPDMNVSGRSKIVDGLMYMCSLISCALGCFQHSIYQQTTLLRVRSVSKDALRFLATTSNLRKLPRPLTNTDGFTREILVRSG